MTPKHNNCFDFLRLVFALLVIVTHSYVLSGYGDVDLLFRITGGQLNFSYLGVRGFFVISGFLIFKSLQKSSGVGDYLTKRFLRIFPAFLVMMLVVTFVLGPFFTTLPATQYFRDGNIWRYFGSALRLPGFQKTAALPGLFNNNPATNAVNGSLWTIWFELIFYIGLLALFFVRTRERALRWLLPDIWLLVFAIFIFAHRFLDQHIFPFTGMSAELAVDLALYFLGGSALIGLPWKKDSRLPLIFFILGCVVLLSGLATKQFYYLRYWGLPMAVIGAGHFKIPVLMRLRRFGEPSYGIYIYAYPIQQIIVQNTALNPWQISLLTIPLAVVAGLLSWHLIEAPFLALKQKVKGEK